VNVAAIAVYQAFRDAAARHAGRPALIYLGLELSYARLMTLAERCAAGLAGLGVRAGDRIILYLPNLPQWVIAWLAAQRLGAVAVPITTFYGPEDLRQIAVNSGAETILCLDTGFGYVARIQSHTPLRRVVVTTMVDCLPLWKRALGRALDRVPRGRVAGGAAVVWFRRLLAGDPSSLPPPAPAGAGPAETVAQLLYTGGTTGVPKAVPINHALFLESLYTQRQQSLPVLPAGHDMVVQGAALYHILGQALGLGALLHGDTVILLPRMNLDALLDHIQRYRATTFFGVPALYRMVLEHDRLDQYDLRSLRYCFTGADVLPREIAHRWQRRVGQPIYPGYGATETAGGVALTPAGGPFPEGATGRVVPFQAVRLVTPGTTLGVPAGEPGELLVASRHMVRGYWNAGDETARAFVDLDGQRWYRTGDLVRIDRDGWVFFVDRSVDTIKHKGYRVAASRVEAVLQEHPAVVGACVVGVSDPAAGERIKAFVVLRADVRGVGPADLIAWCRERLAAYEVPQYVEFRDMLPKSRVGKLLRRELRDEERRKRELT
jgi:long-chain acyl-CoA synthetase